MSILTSWAILAFSMWASAALLPGVQVRGVRGAIVVAAIFGILNYAIGYGLYLALGIGTVGLGFVLPFFSRWLVNALLLKLTDALTDALTIRSFGWNMLCSLLMSGIGTVAQHLLLGDRVYQV